MTAFRKTLLLLAGITSDAQEVTLAEGSWCGGGCRSAVQIKGTVVCTGCSLVEARQARPNEPQLYELMHRRGQVVMKVSSVNDSQVRGRFLWPPWIWVRAQDKVFQQLAAEENRFKEIEITGLLNNPRTLDIFAVTISG